MVRIVAHILRTVFGPKTSIWGSLGVILALLGTPFWWPEQPKGPQRYPNEKKNGFLDFLSPYLGTHVGTFPAWSPKGLGWDLGSGAAAFPGTARDPYEPMGPYISPIGAVGVTLG